MTSNGAGDCGENAIIIDNDENLSPSASSNATRSSDTPPTAAGTAVPDLQHASSTSASFMPNDRRHLPRDTAQPSHESSYASISRDNNTSHDNERDEDAEQEAHQNDGEDEDTESEDENGTSDGGSEGDADEDDDEDVDDESETDSDEEEDDGDNITTSYSNRTRGGYPLKSSSARKSAPSTASYEPYRGPTSPPAYAAAKKSAPPLPGYGNPRRRRPTAR